MDKEKIARINELSKKQLSVGLSEIEKKEQEKLRQEYLKTIRENFRKTLDSIEYKD